MGHSDKRMAIPVKRKLCYAVNPVVNIRCSYFDMADIKVALSLLCHYGQSRLVKGLIFEMIICLTDVFKFVFK